jgi:predicted metal-dependent enzyme (double-stranded beta helix superfamily)
LSKDGKREAIRMKTLTSPNERELRQISGLPVELALPEGARFLARLVEDRAFVEGELLPLLLQEAQGATDWRMARHYEGEDGAYCLQVFVWPPGTGTMVHDHSSWGVYRCVFGSVLEERYERLDDDSVPGRALLKKSWQLAWSPGDGASTVLPGDGGIHRVTNLGDEMALSVHLYGPRMREADGRDYDPSRDYVCDRP